MTFYYAEWIKPKIIEMIEKGTFTLREIADTCKVSIAFVESVKTNYDMFYASRGQGCMNLEGNRNPFHAN